MRRVVVTYDVKEGMGRQLVDAFLASEAVKNIRKEAGCMQYEYYISAEDSDHVVLIEQWENRKLHEAHLAGPNMAPLGEIKSRYTNAQKVESYDEEKQEDIFRKRRSIRSYREEPLKDEELEEILKAGDFAPSGSNSQTTHRIVIQNKEVLDELMQLAMQEFAKMDADESTYISLRNSINMSKKGNYCFFYHAPVLIVTANLREYGNAMADSACMLENMMLKATELGVGSCWINQLHWLDENEVIRKRLEELGLKPEETVTGGLALGYAAAVPSEELERNGNPVTYIK